MVLPITVGGGPVPYSLHMERARFLFALYSFFGKGGGRMVSYEALFLYSDVIISLISLIVLIVRKKK
jgi:hypothetical protein